ncbi:MAG TPA: ribosome assembly cofactor RimP [Bacteroidetes bacterium]|nr:ribosome assembly cofactor RimP [Bacteroidota bacterium]
MVTRERVQEAIEKSFWDDDFFLVDVQIIPGKKVTVYVDRENGITIDECAELSKSLLYTLEGELEDMELTVSSPGLTMPFRVKEQYEKNISRNVEVVMKDGEKFKGKLLGVSDSGFSLLTREATGAGGKKKKQEEAAERWFAFDEVKSTKIAVEFK